MLELKFIPAYPRTLLALDEVGRSPLCGPVVIGAVKVRVESPEVLLTCLRSLRRIGVKDSKALDHEARRDLLQKLRVPVLAFRQKGVFSWKGLCFEHVTWEMDHQVIDQENIYWASLRGMREAAGFLQPVSEGHTTVLIDGNTGLRWPQDAPPWTEHPIVKGDAKSALIGLASIIAKEARDKWMREIHETYPQYGLVRNMGYPTREHREALKKFGPSAIHRRTFRSDFVG